jgi:hypothetical protein
MDPISAFVSLLAVYALFSRLPHLAGEIAREWEYGRQGQMSPAARARRQRLLDAGIDPATGGPARQYLANLWRDTWIDLDAKRTASRAQRHDSGARQAEQSWWTRLADRVDDEVTRRADRWRQRQSETGTPPRQPDPTEGPTGHARDHRTSPAGPTGPAQPGRPGPAPTPQPVRPPIQAVVIPTPRPEQQPTRQQQEPPSTLEGELVMANGTMVHVTGTASAIAEARAIATQLDAVHSELNQNLARVRSRLHQLGESMVSTVQMQVRSRVVANIATSAEALAAAAAAAEARRAEAQAAIAEIIRALHQASS